MKCPNDQTEMENGSLMMNGTGWVKFTNWLVRGWHFGAKKVVAWKCPKCGKIELYAEEKK